MGDVWLTSDWHLGDEETRIYSQRPFATVAEMDAALIRNWNSRVKHGDTGIFIGDVFPWSVNHRDEILDQLNGSLVLVAGNHDTNLKRRMMGGGAFEEVVDYYEISDGGDLFCLSHYPMTFWNRGHSGSYMLHGHAHGGLEPESERTQVRRLDVGCDVHEYFPINLNDVRGRLSGRDWTRHYEHANGPTMRPLPEGR